MLLGSRFLCRGDWFLVLVFGENTRTLTDDKLLLGPLDNFFVMFLFRQLATGFCDMSHYYCNRLHTEHISRFIFDYARLTQLSHTTVFLTKPSTCHTYKQNDFINDFDGTKLSSNLLVFWRSSISNLEEKIYDL